MFEITDMMDMGLYLCLCWFLGWGIMLANFQMCGIMLLLRAVLYMLVRNVSTRGPMYFSYLMFSLSEPCELGFLFCFIASWT